MKLIIEDDEGRRTIVPFLGEALNIGRADDNQVRLGEKNVSRKHGRIVRKSGLFVVEDFSTFCGIRVNGEKVKGKRQVKEGDLIQISEFDLQLEAGPDDLPKVDAEAQPALGLDDEEVTSVPTAEELSARRHDDTAVIKLQDVVPALKAAEYVDVAEAEQPRLVGVNGAQRGIEFPLKRSPASVGRALENDVCLDHPQVSRSHCRMAIVGGGWKVIDAESRHGVKVNGEPYAASPLHHGDVLEVGPVRLMFAMPGKPVTLPDETAELAEAPAVSAAMPAAAIAAPAATTTAREVLAPAAKGLGAAKVALIAGAVLIAAAAAVLLLGHGRAPRAEALDEADAALQRAGTSAAAHHYREAVRSLQAAVSAGASPTQTRVLPSLEIEAHAEEQYRLLVQAIGRGDFDAAQSLLDRLGATPTWYGGLALEHTQEIKAGYVKLHVERANAERGRDDAACLTEANLALAANPQSEPARALASECGAPGATAHATRPAIAPARPAPAEAEPKRAAPPPAPAHAKVAAPPAPPSPADDAEARRLLKQGNTEATAGDLTSAIGDFERALKLRPTGPVLGSLYRSLGATYSRAGNADQGAHYYKLYLPFCDNPTEKSFLQKTLDDYAASRRKH